MAEYIERELLLKELKQSREWHAETSKDFSLLVRCENIVREQTAADVVEVVRCKDCELSRPLNRKYPFENILVEGVIWCTEHGRGVFEDGFCSCAKRKEQ